MRNNSSQAHSKPRGFNSQKRTERISANLTFGKCLKFAEARKKLTNLVKKIKNNVFIEKIIYFV